MITLELDESQAETLHGWLHDHLADLSYEIADTDSKDYRDKLKAKRDALAKVEADLAGALGLPGK